MWPSWPSFGGVPFFDSFLVTLFERTCSNWGSPGIKKMFTPPARGKFGGPKRGGQQEESKDLRRLVDPKGSADSNGVTRCKLRPKTILAACSIDHIFWICVGPSGVT